MVSALLEPTSQTPEMKAIEAIRDIPREDVTSRMIRYQQALAEVESAAPAAIPLGRRGIYHKRRFRDKFRH